MSPERQATCAITICRAEFPNDLTTVTALFNAYADSLRINLSYQNFHQEIASLPGKYAAEKGGALFLARTSASPDPPTSTPAPTTTPTTSPDGDPRITIGCVCVRALKPPTTCELKRLYIAPQSRGLGVGRMLLERAIEEARILGYREMLLDTLPSMVEARNMYAKYGFEEVGSYYEGAREGTVFLRLGLV